jgi:hypothetical protein
LKLLGHLLRVAVRLVDDVGEFLTYSIEALRLWVD